jgi:hypothetical protein
VALGAIADHGHGVVLEVLLAQLLAAAPSETMFDAIEALVDSQEASPLASRHALFAIVSFVRWSVLQLQSIAQTHRRLPPWCRQSQ